MLPSSSPAPKPGEWALGLGSAKPIACDATAGSDLDAVTASRTIEAEEDGPAAWCAVADSADLIGDNLRHGAPVPGVPTQGPVAGAPRRGAAVPPCLLTTA